MAIDSLYTIGAYGDWYESVAYKVAGTATQANLDAIALPENLNFLDYYTENTSSCLHPTEGTNTLGGILKQTGNQKVWIFR